ncbi:MAG: hypothetical protein HKM93_16790 [Desulfobacteraceae bacterium]|nr:hypothetical protein [Desulfobacteraceae bacterium]
MKKAIDFTDIISRDTIVPAECPPMENSPYRAGYDWLFRYERKLARFLDPWLGEFRHELIGVNGILCEALSNAFCHGHRKDPTLAIHLNVYLGTKGLVLEVIDTGKGFNVQRVVDACEKGKAYYHVAGNGLRSMMASDNFAVFFNHTGTACHIVRLHNADYGCIKRISHQRPLNVSGIHTSANGNHTRNTGEGSITADGNPPLSWANAGILAGINGRVISFYGIRPKAANRIAGFCIELVQQAIALSRTLETGDPEQLWIETDSQYMLVSYPADTDRIIIALLDENANPVHARFHLPEIIAFLNDNHPHHTAPGN